MVFKLVWGLELLCFKRKTVLWPDLTLEIQVFSLASQCHGQNWWFVRVPGNPEGSPLSYLKRLNNTSLTEDCVLNFFFKGNSHVAIPWAAVLTASHSWWPHVSSQIMMHLRRVSLSALYWFSRTWRTCIQCSFCSCVEHLWDPPGANFAVFQHCYHSFQHTKADIQFCTEFSGYNLPVCVDELIVTLCFVVWQLCMASQNMVSYSCCCCHCQNTPPTASLCSHPLFGLQKHSANVHECQLVPFFPHGGIQLHTFASSAPPCQMLFCQTAPLLPSVTQQQNVIEYW